MVWTGRVEYDGCIVIIIGVNIVKISRRVYVIDPASIYVIITVITIFIIFSRDVVIVSLIIFWFGVRNFILQSIKDLKSDGGSP